MPTDSQPTFAPECRATKLTADFSSCQTKPHLPCEFFIPFGFGGFCKHPRHQEIVARTSAINKTHLEHIAA